MSEKPRIRWVEKFGKNGKFICYDGIPEGASHLEAFVDREAFEQLRAERDEAHKLAVEIATKCQDLEIRCFGYAADRSIFEERDQLRSQLAVAREALENCTCEQVETLGVRCRKNQPNKCQRCEALKQLTDEEK